MKLEALNGMTPATVAPSRAQGSADAAIQRAKGVAKNGDTAQIAEASRQLEGIFLSMVFEEMAKTVDSTDTLVPRSPGQDMYEQWFRSEVASDWSRRGGVGLGGAITRSLGASPAPHPAPAAAPRLHAAVSRPSAPAPAIPPVQGRVTSSFGPRVHPISGKAELHNGVDIAVPEGSPVRCPFDGTVVSVNSEDRGGLSVVVQHANGYTSGYAHLSRALVKPGDLVGSGQVIAESGNSGTSTGPHVHFAVQRFGQPVDATGWFRF